MSNILELMVCILMSLNINSVNSITVDRVEDGITTLEVVTDTNIYMYNKPSEWYDFDGMVYYKIDDYLEGLE